ncbi:MAG: PglZ domain-containing protein [Bacteroidota bacterium]|nr:PglZ domain-containing protein [Bacteroidota bacterium]
MQQGKILWADDEIDLLKPHILFLQQRGYEVTAVHSGNEAIEESVAGYFDIIFLDENMPGLSGIETLTRIKAHRPDVPVVMITKSEEEFLMEDAIGSQISDYLIKPVNPNQILLSVKKILQNKQLVSQKVTMSYQQDFGQLSMRLNDSLDADEWIEVYKKLVFWEMELEKSDAEGMKDVFEAQKTEAGSNFSRFIDRNYLDWQKNKAAAPVMSDTLLSKKVLPHLKGDLPVYFLLIDNLRYDQWRAMMQRFTDMFRIQEDTAYYSILPTATQYARNAIFSGMMPVEIEKRMPDLWLNDEDEGGKNLHEEEFFKDYLSRMRMDIKYSYHKITNLSAGRNLSDNMNSLLNNKLNIIIYNFVDLLSHMRTEMVVIKELAEDEKAYRSLTLSWLDNSPLFEIIKKIAEKPAILIVSTDHGSVRVKKPSKIMGDRNTTTNLRYKTGKNLNFQEKEVLAIKHPEQAGLPRQHVSSSFVFAKEDHFFVYPNNLNYYVNFYRNTFQHGGISLEEMLVPVVTMQSK